MVETAHGLRLSAGLSDGLVSYTVSRVAPPLHAGEAADLAAVIHWLRHRQQEMLLLPGAAGAFHIVMQPERVRLPRFPGS